MASRPRRPSSSALPWCRSPCSTTGSQGCASSCRASAAQRPNNASWGRAQQRIEPVVQRDQPCRIRPASTMQPRGDAAQRCGGLQILPFERQVAECVSGNSTLKQQGMSTDGKHPHRAITGPAIQRRSCRRNSAGITHQSQHRRHAVGGQYRLQPGCRWWQWARHRRAGASGADIHRASAHYGNRANTDAA